MAYLTASQGFFTCTSFYKFTMKVLDGSHERAMLAWANSWISDRLDRMSKQGDSPNYECGGSCGSAKGAPTGTQTQRQAVSAFGSVLNNRRKKYAEK